MSEIYEYRVIEEDGIRSFCQVCYDPETGHREISYIPKLQYEEPEQTVAWLQEALTKPMIVWDAKPKAGDG